MRRALALLLLAGCAGPGGSEIYSEAPDFEARTIEGAVVQGAELWSKESVLLVFMTTW